LHVTPGKKRTTSRPDPKNHSPNQILPQRTGKPTIIHAGKNPRRVHTTGTDYPIRVSVGLGAHAPDNFMFADLMRAVENRSQQALGCSDLTLF